MWRNLVRLARYRGLIQSLVARELKARYRGSVLGFFWSFVNPLLLLSIYTFVFAYILPNPEERTRPYSVFMFCGLLPWTWFSASLLEATGSLISGGNLIKKVLFPAEVLPIVSVLSNMVHFFLGLLILAGFMIGTQHFPDPGDLIFFPLVVLIQLIFTVALSLILSALTVHFRDIRDLLANLLTFWFFATPIIYFYRMETRAALPVAVRHQPVLPPVGVVSGDPVLPRSVRRRPPETAAADGPASCALFLFGYWLFDRLRDSFAEVV